MSIYDEISGKLDKLYEQIRPDELSWIEDAKKTFLLFTKFEKLKDFVKAIEYVKKEIERDSTKEKDIKAVKEILIILQRSEPDYLIENLRRVGYAIANENESLRNAINNEALRILEQVRLGKRDTVIGMLMRNFIVRNVSIPSELIEALKPKYDTNLFRAFIYAFLSGFINKQE